MNNHPFSGVSYLLTGFSLIIKPGLRRFVILPILINVFLFVGLFFLLQHFMAELNAWFTHFLPAWLQWLSWFLWLLFAISYLLIFIFTFVALGNIVSAPFNSLLAEQVEYYLTGKTLPSRTWLENIKDVPRIFARQLAILMYFIPRALLLLLLFVIPVLQLIAAPLWFLFNAWFMTLTYLDYPTDNHHISFQAMRAWLTQRQWAGISFGASILVASMIPILNLFVMPAAVAAGTAFWLHERGD